MKLKRNNKYFSIAMYTLFVICSSIIFFIFIYNFDGVKHNIKYITGIIKPFIIAFCIAYMLNLVMDWFEKKLFSEKRFPKMKSGLKRTLSIVLTYLIFLAVIAGFLNYILPQIYNSIVNLVYYAPEYVSKSTKTVTGFLNGLNIKPEIINFVVSKFNEIGKVLSGKMETLIPFFANIATSTLSIFGNAILGIFISFYMLLDKERFSGNSKKVLIAIFPKKISSKILKVLRMLNNSVRAFIGAKAIDAVIIGVIFYVVLLVLDAKYAMLLAFILGLTNMIPWFGCYLGAIPTIIVLAFQDPTKVWWFVIALLIIAQVDANVISPKIQGEKLGLSPFWIMLALVVGGSMFGFMGFILGVPVFSVIYQLISEWTNNRLKEKSLPVNISDYYNLKDDDLLANETKPKSKLKSEIFEEDNQEETKN